MQSDQKKIRILTITDAETRNQLEQAFISENDIELAGFASNSEIGVQKIMELQPDIALVSLYVAYDSSDNQTITLSSGKSFSVQEALRLFDRSQIKHLLRSRLANVIALSQEISQQSPLTQVIVIAPHSLMGEELRLLLRVNVKEILLMPFDANELAKVVRRINH